MKNSSRSNCINNKHDDDDDSGYSDNNDSSDDDNRYTKYSGASYQARTDTVPVLHISTKTRTTIRMQQQRHASHLTSVAPQLKAPPLRAETSGRLSIPSFLRDDIQRRSGFNTHDLRINSAVALSGMGENVDKGFLLSHYRLLHQREVVASTHAAFMRGPRRKGPPSRINRCARKEQTSDT